MGDYNPKLIIYILFLSTFSLNTPLSIVGVIVEISKYFNTSIFISGLFVSSFTFTIALTGLFIPVFFRKVERRKLFSCILLIFTLSNFLPIFSNNLFFALFLRVFSGIFYSVFISIALTVASEIAPSNMEQDYIIKVLLGISIGSIIGLPISTSIGTAFGFKFSLLWISLINFLSFILVLLVFPKMEVKTINSKVNYGKVFSKDFLISILGIIMLPIGIGLIYNYMSYFLQTTFNIFTFNLSLILFIYGLVSIVGTYLGGKFIVKNSKLTIISFPLISIVVLLLLSFLGEYLLPAIVLLLIVGFLDGGGYNIIQYFQVSFLSDSLELANGIFLSILNGGIAIGTALGGFIVSNSGVMSMFSLSTIPLFIALIIFYYLINFNKNTKKIY